MTVNSLLELSFWVPLLAAAVRVATPFLFAALGEATAERAGLLNVGIEGMMILGALCGFVVAYVSGNPWIGLAAGAAAGLAAGLLFGAVTVLRGADQIVTGIVLNILAFGIAAFAYQRLYASAADVPQLISMRPLRLPWLSTLPVIGRPFFAQAPIVYAAFLLVPVFWLVLEYSRWGLNIRAAGENPQAVDSAGIDVWHVRLQAIAVGGAMAGLAGATISVAQVGAYLDGMIAGRGFITLAIVVFGAWKAWRVAGAALLFGFADALQLRLQVAGIGLPNQLLIGLPYLLTIIVVVIVADRAGYPAAINRPYLRRRGVSRRRNILGRGSIAALADPLPSPGSAGELGQQPKGEGA